MALSLISAIVLFDLNSDKLLFDNCLKSISWCDEIIKIDTTKIKGSFNEWRNEGLKRAKNKWLLYLDTDEEITSSLRDEIIRLTNSPSKQNAAYAIPRKNIIFGKEFKYGGQWPDYQQRLFLKSKLIAWTGELHEQPVFRGKLGYLNNPIIHHKNMTIGQMIEKTNKWSEIEAKLMFDGGHPKMNLARFMTAGLREFYQRFIRQLCFLDGTKGIIYGIYQVYSRLISYSKLWERQLSTIRT